MSTPSLPKEIRATIHEDAIQKVSRFFNATTAECLNELLQNSRRSGATRVDITFQDSTVTVTDDGRGVQNPEALQPAHRVPNPPVDLSGLPGRFRQQLRPRFRASGPDNNPPTSPQHPFPGPVARFSGLPGARAVWTPPVPVHRPCGPPQAKVHGSPLAHHRRPKGKKKAGPPGPRSNRQPQSPATGR